MTNEQIRKDLMEHVIKPVVPAKYMDDKTIFHLNPSGESRSAPPSVTCTLRGLRRVWGRAPSAAAAHKPAAACRQETK